MLQRLFGNLILTSFILLATDGAGGGASNASKYEKLTVPLLEKEILDREIDVDIKDMAKKDLVALLVKDDEMRGSGKIIVPTFDEYVKAYPEATQDGYAHRFCGFIAGQECTELQIEANQKKLAEDTAELERRVAQQKQDDLKKIAEADAIERKKLQESTAQVKRLASQGIRIDNRCNAPGDVLTAIAAKLDKSESWQLCGYGPTQCVLVGSVTGYQKVAYK